MKQLDTILFSLKNDSNWWNNFQNSLQLISKLTTHTAAAARFVNCKHPTEWSSCRVPTLVFSTRVNKWRIIILQTQSWTAHKTPDCIEKSSVLLSRFKLGKSLWRGESAATQAYEWAWLTGSPEILDVIKLQRRRLRFKMQQDRVLAAAAVFINKRSHMSDFYVPAKSTRRQSFHRKHLM